MNGDWNLHSWAGSLTHPTETRKPKYRAYYSGIIVAFLGKNLYLGPEKKWKKVEPLLGLWFVWSRVSGKTRWVDSLAFLATTVES